MLPKVPGPRGYPGPAGYPPPTYPPYGYPPPPPLLNRPHRPPQQRGREGEKEKRSAGKPLHSLTPAQTAGGISNDYCSRLCCHTVIDGPKGKKAKSKSSPMDYSVHGTKG